MNFVTTPRGVVSKREAQIILKTGERSIRLELGAIAKLSCKINMLGEKSGLPRGRQAGGRGQEQALGAHASAGEAAGAEAGAALLPGRLSDTATTGKNA